MKVFRKDKILDNDLIDKISKEKEALYNIDHPFLVCMRYGFFNDERLFFLMDFVSGGQLYDYLHEKQRLPENQVKLYITTIASAIGHLHDKNLIHGDIQSTNIFIANDGYLILADHVKS